MEQFITKVKVEYNSNRIGQLERRVHELEVIVERMFENNISDITSTLPMESEIYKRLDAEAIREINRGAEEVAAGSYVYWDASCIYLAKGGREGFEKWCSKHGGEFDCGACSSYSQRRAGRNAI